MTLALTAHELAALAAIPALLLAFHGVRLRLLAGAICSLLIPAVVIGTVHLPPEHQLSKARVRCASRTSGRNQAARSASA